MDHLIQQSICRKGKQFCKGQKQLSKGHKAWMNSASWVLHCFLCFIYYTRLNCCTYWSDHKVWFHLSNYVIFVSDNHNFSSVQFSCSVVSDSLRPHESQHTRPPCPSPTPGVQIRIHRVRDAIQPSHPLSSPSPPAPNPSQHQSLFQWVNSSHEVAKVLEFQL